MQMLGGMSIETFLRDYWQKKPLLIRQAFPDFQCPIEADELAGLSCEEGVESRIVLEEEHGKPWQLHHGPFEESTFEALPSENWTLVVQGLDHWVPEVADLLAEFRFIPNWRLDDIMASFAPAGGSLGPHYEHDDVFLLQGQGQRCWKLGGRCDENTARVEGTPLRILSDWETVEEFVLEPGDMLYLPPNIARWGVAEDDSITLSIGFRSPTHEEILTRYAEYACDLPGIEQHLDDSHRQLQGNPGLIDDQVLDDLERILRERLMDRRQLALWFGQFSTEPKHEHTVQPPEDSWNSADIAALINEDAILRWNEGSRFAFHTQDDETFLFVDGERFILRGEAQSIAPILCSGHRFAGATLQPFVDESALLELIVTLFNQGSLYDE